MADLSGNSCNIVTLLPLGIDCDVINASTPDAANGYMAVLITGGTPPYNVYWDNGSQGTYITNLIPGNYTATVVDYYGDFSATTTCTVGYESFYLEKFQKCTLIPTPTPQYVYYIASTPSLFTVGKSYKLTTQTGCWNSLGLELNTGQTYVNSVAVKSSGPYNSCLTCITDLNLPQPTQPYNGPLCFTRFTHPATINQTTFNSGSTINNYLSWTAGTQTIYYNTGTTRWTISGWTTPNVPYLQNPNTPPVGTWTIPGAFISNINVTTGTCTTSPLQITVQTQNPACSTSYGSATVSVIGGTPPYVYSLDNINFTSSNFLTNLTAGPKTVYVKDSSPLQNSGSQTFSIVPLVNYTNYLLNVNFNTQGPLSNTPNQTASSASLTQNTTFNISLTPNTPFNQPTTVQFDLVFDVSTTAHTSTTTQPIITNTINVTSTTATTLNSPTTTTPTTTSSPRSGCVGAQIITSGYQITYPNCIITNTSASFSGSISQYIYEVCNTNSLCVLKGKSKITLQVKNISLSPLNCQGIDSTIITRTAIAEKTGPLCPAVL